MNYREACESMLHAKQELESAQMRLSGHIRLVHGGVDLDTEAANKAALDVNIAYMKVYYLQKDYHIDSGGVVKWTY